MSSIFNYRINLLILLITFLFANGCCKDDASKPEEQSRGASNSFFALKLSPQEYDYWNHNDIFEEEALQKVHHFGRSSIYSIFKDDFDFIIFVLNNDTLPKTLSNSGLHFRAKNDIQGIGLSIYDNTHFFGSAGRLQSICFLNSNAIDRGPILHEITHRWANYVVPQEYEDHWDKVKGILTDNSNDFADIELYLAGAIPASDIKDPESLAIYNDPRFRVKTRIPDYLHAQKDFNALVVVLTPRDLTDKEAAKFKERIDNITRVPSQGSTERTYQNMYNKTRGLLTLSIGNLHKSRK